MKRRKDGQINRQTDKFADREMGRIQMDRRTDKQIHRQTDR